MLYLNIIESSFDVKGERSKVVDQPIFRIGRAPNNDWVLDCPKKLISRHHCIIEGINDAYTINDLSKNGVVINNSPTPIGIGNIGSLNDGDVINLPGVKISVSFSKSVGPVKNDPFLKLLPSRDKPSQIDPIISDPLLVSESNKKDTKQENSRELDLLTLSSRAPTPYIEGKKFLNIRSTPPDRGIALDRRPAEFSSFQSALPQIMIIPEDWNKEGEGQQFKSSKAQPRQNVDRNISPQIKLLLHLINRFCDIDTSLSNSSKSNLMFLSAEEKLKYLDLSDLCRAISIIDDITARLASHIPIGSNLPRDSRHEDETIAGNDQ